MTLEEENPIKPSADFKFIKPGEIRTRIAPSPTGFLHIGSARTALFNFLFAKQNQGDFILRIEDTDTERSRPEFEKDILEGLKWLGIEWDEGPDIGGEYGPYRQSDKLNVYRKYLEKLIAEDRAYYCFCSEEELEAQRQYQMSIGEAPRYNGKCSQLVKQEAKKRLAQGEKAAIRFRVIPKKVAFDDIIRGHLEFDAGLFGDIIIAKDLNHPLYNFAAVVDDSEMKISHIIRGEEFLSSTPKQILIQEALGFPKIKYSHLPLVLAPDRRKLSKRYGATAVNEYKKEGYLAEALINFIAFLGWNPGGEREIYSLASLIKEFSLEHCQKSGAVFNIRKLESLNGFYLRQKSISKLTEMCLPYLMETGFLEKMEPAAATSEPEKLVLGVEAQEKPEFRVKETNETIGLNRLEKIIAIYQERLKKLSEISELTDFFFKKNLKYDKKLLSWKEATDKETKKSLEKLAEILSAIDNSDWAKENLEKVLGEEAIKFSAEKGTGWSGDRGYLLWPLRLALSGKEASAGPFEIAEILGKEKTLKRIKEAIKLC